MHPAADIQLLLDRIRAGDPAALDELLSTHRDAVRRFLELRMDGKLRARVDVSDVIQEAHLEVARRINDYLGREPMPFRVWLLRTAQQQLLRLRRHHVEAACRAAGAEAALPESSSIMLAERLAGPAQTPSLLARRRELADQVQAALAELGELDREIILLRTFEQLSNLEVAQMLEIEPDTASKRYTRALLRLRQVLKGVGVTGTAGE